MADLANEAMKQGAVPVGYDEVVVDFFQFNSEGDNIAGRLVNKTQVQIRGNRVGKYTIITPENKRVAFLGGVHLDELMSNVGLGREVMVQFTHREKTGQDNSGNEMKRFKVFVKSTM